MRPIQRVITAFTAELRASAALVALVEGDPHRIRRRVGAANVPGVEYTIIDDGEEEHLAPADIQFSFFGEGFREVLEMEDLVYQLLYKRAPQVIQGVPMIVEYLGGRTVDDPAEGVVHRAVDYRFTPTRS